MDKVIFAVWNVSYDGKELLDKIKEYFISKLNKPIAIIVEDLKRLGSTDYDEDKEVKAVIVFGKTAANYLSSHLMVVVPGVEEMMPHCMPWLENKKALMEALNEVAESLNKPPVPPTHVSLETKEKVSVGLTACDINITKNEVEHVKRIRDILGGGKIVITKGDIKIEVEE